jgi:hypothetical protein
MGAASIGPRPIRGAAPPRYSEYEMFIERDVERTVMYLTNVLIPSLHRVGPSWVPSALRRVFFHETTIQRRPDHLGSYDSFPAEHWFFINGILTDSGMGRVERGLPRSHVPPVIHDRPERHRWSPR